MRAIIQDTTGAYFQWLDTETIEYRDEEWKPQTSTLGGWYDLSCRPVPEHAITHPVTVMWRRDN